MIQVADASQRRRNDVSDTAQHATMPAWQRGDILGVDIGGVLSQYTDTRPSDDAIYRSVDPGAYPFIMLYALQFGLEHFAIISRTNQGSKTSHSGRHDSWVTKFVKALGVEELGMPYGNFSVCKQWRQKGNIAASHPQFRMMVDDTEDVLRYIHARVPHAELKLYSSSGQPRRTGRRKLDIPWSSDDENSFHAQMSHVIMA